MAEQQQFLSKAEVAEFTRAKTKATQLRMLVANGIRHYVDNHGWPAVTRAAIEGWKEDTQNIRLTWWPNKAL